MDETDAPTAEPHPLRVREWRNLYLAGWIDQFGTQVLFLVLPLLAYDLTGSAGAFASSFGAASLGLLVASVFGGVLTDRLDRRRMFLAGCVVEAVLTVSVIGAAAAHSWIAIAVVAGLLGLAGACLGGGITAMGPMLLTSDGQRSRANALKTMVISTNILVAPGLGAAIYHLAGFPAVVGVDLVTYAVAATLVWRTHIHASVRMPNADVPGARSWWRTGLADIHLAAGEVGRNGFLSRSIAATLFMGAGNGLFLVVMMPWIHDVLHAPRVFFSVFITAVGLSGVLTSLVMARVGHRFDPERVFVAGAVVGPLVTVGFFLAHSVPVALAVCLVAGVGNVLNNIAAMTLMQRVVHGGMLGRIGAFNGSAFQLAQVIGIGLGGVFAPALGAVGLLEAWVALTFAYGLLDIAAFRALRRMEPESGAAVAPAA